MYLTVNIIQFQFLIQLECIMILKNYLNKIFIQDLYKDYLVICYNNIYKKVEKSSPYIELYLQ